MIKKILTLKNLKNEIKDLKNKLQIEKLKNNIYTQIIDQKLGIKFHDKNDKNTDDTKLNDKDLKEIYTTLHILFNKETIKVFTSMQYQSKTIFLKFDYNENNNIPKNIFSVYYLN